MNIVRTQFLVAKEALGAENNKTKYVEKFSEDQEQWIYEKKKAYIKWLSCKRVQSSQEYVGLRNTVKAMVKQGKEGHWERVGRNIGSTIGYNKPTEAL